MSVVEWAVLSVCAAESVVILALMSRLRAKRAALRSAPVNCAACGDSGYADYAAVPCEACGGASRSR